MHASVAPGKPIDHRCGDATRVLPCPVCVGVVQLALWVTPLACKSIDRATANLGGDLAQGRRVPLCVAAAYCANNEGCASNAA